MKRFFSAVALVTFSIVGCGDDDDDNDPNGTAGTSSGEAGSPSTGEAGSPSTGEAGSPSTGTAGSPSTGTAGSPSGEAGAPSGTGGAPTGNVPCDPEADTVCQNATDCPFVATGEARQTAGVCGQTCLLSGSTDEACPVDCILEAIDMTQACAGCYAETTACGIMNCAGECLDDPEAEVCQTCLVDAGCRDAFSECSGLE